MHVDAHHWRGARTRGAPRGARYAAAPGKLGRNACVEQWGNLCVEMRQLGALAGRLATRCSARAGRTRAALSAFRGLSFALAVWHQKAHSLLACSQYDIHIYYHASRETWCLAAAARRSGHHTIIMPQQICQLLEQMHICTWCLFQEAPRAQRGAVVGVVQLQWSGRVAIFGRCARGHHTMRKSAPE